MDLKELKCPTCGFPAPEIVQQTYFKCPACGSVSTLIDIQKETALTCPKCRQINQNDQQYCSGCGQKLQVSCPFCYAPNPINSINCESCGVNLQTAEKRKRDWLEEYNQKNEERLALTRQAEADGEKARLKELITDLEEPEKHSFAIYCLNQMGDHAVEALINTLQTSSDPDARFGAAIALGNIANKAAVPALTRALQDTEPAVRYWAIDALQKFAAQNAIGAIKECLADPHRGVKERARQALEALGVRVDKPSKWPFG